MALGAAGLLARQDMAAAFAAKGLWGFLAIGDPGTGNTVANEAAGGSPAYARVSLAGWSAPDANGQITVTVTFNVPAGTYTYAGIATSQSGATRYASGPITSTTYGSQALHTQTFILQVL